MDREEFKERLENHKGDFDHTTVALLASNSSDGNLKAIGRKYFLELQVLEANLIKDLQNTGIKIEGDWD